MQNYRDHWFTSNNGLKLYARDYLHHSPAATIICIPGLTRNSADFASLCQHLASHYRVIAVDLRGRGRSAYDPDPKNYHPGSYAEDMIALLDSLALDSAVFIGTSLGGLVSMLLSNMQPQRVKAVILNDIGPQIHQPGLDRINTYVCNPASVSSWAEAISKTREVQKREYPGFTDTDWLNFTHKLYREDETGTPILNYDPRIAMLIELQRHAPTANLWPLFSAMQAIPLLLLRGELSEILTKDCVSKMQSQKPDMQFTEVPSCGHAPLLVEHEATEAIDGFLVSLW
jgi:pimeloyl-ACP methyl ester carboxylesterase